MQYISGVDKLHKIKYCQKSCFVNWLSAGSKFRGFEEKCIDGLVLVSVENTNTSNTCTWYMIDCQLHNICNGGSSTCKMLRNRNRHVQNTVPPEMIRWVTPTVGLPLFSSVISNSSVQKTILPTTASTTSQPIRGTSLSEWNYHTYVIRAHLSILVLVLVLVDRELKYRISTNTNNTHIGLSLGDG